MTPGTGKRSYRACLRCRRRKAKCNLDGVGEPKKPPCVSCHESGSQCVLVESRRGGNFRSSRPGQGATHSSQRSTRSQGNARGTLAVPSISEHDNASPSTNDSEMDHDGDEEQTKDDSLRMELRNPSDALQILARSSIASSNRPSSHDRRQNGHSSAAEAPTISSMPRPSSSIGNIAAVSHVGQHRNSGLPPTAALDNYELVQRGLLHPSVLPELLLKFAQDYHPYCPIVPSYMLGPSGMQKLQRSDYFLLTVVLTIASRDSPNHSLTHRYCWDHTQRLLLEILLTQPWTQTPRTVEGLLLLSEWLPHIQTKQPSSGTPNRLFGEDRTAWSLVGLAVRQGYLLGLDRGAFRRADDRESKEREERSRIVWTYVFLVDRQISARLGQSFWSRGPSLSSQFTAADFPSLKPVPGVRDEDYASVLQANIELTQILHNAHAILYSSTQKTLTMVYDGDYARYLDDFLGATTSWHAKWLELGASHEIKSTLLLTNEYICLYVNAFSFQAVLTRTTAPQRSMSKRQWTRERPLDDLFSRGISSSPDGRYVFEAISAAKKLLGLMNGLDPQRVIRHLPLRFYLYGVYATVFLYKAKYVGAFQNDVQRQEVADLVLRFIAVLKEAPSMETHICHSYSRMLGELWHGREASDASSRTTRPQSNTEMTRYEEEEPGNVVRSTRLPLASSLVPARADQDSPAWDWNSLGNIDPYFAFGNLGQGSDVPAFPTIEAYPFGSFWPGITDPLRQEEFQYSSWEQQDPSPDEGGFGDTGVSFPGTM